VPGEHKRWRHRGEVDLAAQSKTAGGVGEATCAACYGRSLMVVVQSRRSRRAQVSLKGAVNFVAVGRKPVKGAGVGNIWRVVADVLLACPFRPRSRIPLLA
jgi:hypothetical protein